MSEFAMVSQVWNETENIDSNYEIIRTYSVEIVKVIKA